MGSPDKQIDWIKVLDNYGYPNRPCDKCVNRCFERLSCPMFQAFKARVKQEKVIQNKEK